MIIIVQICNYSNNNDSNSDSRPITTGEANVTRRPCTWCRKRHVRSKRTTEACSGDRDMHPVSGDRDMFALVRIGLYDRDMFAVYVIQTM